jgi:hypothetical protein
MLAYAVAIGIFVVGCLGILAIVKLPGWLARFGVSLSGVALIGGTTSCALGAWIIRAERSLSSVVIGSLSFLSGIIPLGRAFAFF